MSNTPLFDLKIQDAAKNSLKYLNLSVDITVSSPYRLSSIPAEIFELTHLEDLNLAGHKIETIPADIGKLRNLKVLRLEFCNLTSVSDAIGDLQNLSKLRLWADKNARVIPLQFLSQLTKLADLHLVGFRLGEVPSWIQQFTKLESLNLSGNDISTLSSWMGTLRNLRSLNLDDNKFTELPEALYDMAGLETLSLRNLSGSDRNQILEISPQLLRLVGLTELDLHGNPIEIPPPEIVSKGLDAIREYLQQLEVEGTDHLYEAKLLIVGEGGAGKTSLAKKIENPNYALKEEDSTKGIEVNQWTFNMEDGQPFRINIWDFGGQEIYHSTHQFFLTKRSLYVLIADNRKEDTDFYYWLNVVELFSDDSPILIIKNEKQDRKREININHLRGQFPSLKEILATNLATNRGLDSVLDYIKYHISHLPQIGASLPKPWVRVREALEKEPRNYVSSVEYLQICQDNGFVDLKDKLQLLGYLHDLGVCLHFVDDPLLKKTVILKPKWGTDAVYKVLDNTRVIENFGKFNRDALREIWHEPEYAETQDELLQLMINFRLCYRIPDSEFYIAPQLLTENQPSYDWDESNNLILRYSYEFMPKGIVTQFIVMTHGSIAKEDWVWRSGVILAKDDTQAEVAEYYGKREIKIRVTGKRKKELMTIVTYVLDKIHSSYPRLKYNKLIPCNCSQCKSNQHPHFYRYETLQRFKDKRCNQIQCEMSGDMVNVEGLIDDVIDYDKHKTLSEIPRRGQIFVSYSHKDKRWLDEFRKMLRPLTRSGQLSLWVDTEITAGSKWRDEIKQALKSAKVAVLLVSPDFLASDFIAEQELTPLLAAAETQGLTILWVPVSDSMYKVTEIAKYQAASDPAIPLDTLPLAEANRVVVRICEQVKEAANR